METTTVVERDCSALGGLFQIVVNDMKGGTPVWEDFVVKATKFHTQLKATILASTAFLDAFQKIADMATSTRGGTKDIGSALTRLCLRHRSVEARLKTFSSSVMDCLILPLQDRLEDWKKTTSQLDKDHAKEYKRLRQELKKRHLFDGGSGLSVTSNTLKLQKKVRGSAGVGGTGSAISSALSKSMDSMEGNEKLFMLEEMEKKAVRRALIEERSRFCLFVNYFRPVVEEELAMLQEVTHLQEIMEALSKLTSDPYVLPSSSELVIADLKLNSGENVSAWTQMNLQQTPPSSPSSFGSRKSSMCSISSFNSSSSGSTHSPSHSHSQSHHNHCRYRSLSQLHNGAPPLRMSSISSQDSGFISQQDYNLFTAGNNSSLPPTTAAILRTCIETSSTYDSSRFVNCEVSSMSEQSSGSTSSTSSVPPTTAQWTDGNNGARPHTISTAYEKSTRPPLTSQTFEPPTNGVNSSSSSSKNSGGGTNTSSASEESLVHNENPGEETPPTPVDKVQPPVVPSRDVSIKKPLIPEKPVALKNCDDTTSISSSLPVYCGVTFAPQAVYDSQPIYANASDWGTNEEVNLACSEGSITPTNPERSSSPTVDYPVSVTSYQATYQSAAAASSAPLLTDNSTRPLPPRPPTLQPKESSIYSSSGTLSRSGKPPPPPPIRRTSSISNPNAITLGTLRNAGCSTYEEIKTLKRNASYGTYDDISRLGNVDDFGSIDSQPIYSNATSIYSQLSSTDNPVDSGYEELKSQMRSEYQHAKHLFEAVADSKESGITLDGEELPPPPPEAYSETEGPQISQNTHASYNRITNIHRDFLQTLNAKLSIPQNQNVSPRLQKRRSMSLPHGEQDWDSDSGISESVTGSSSTATSVQSNSIQQSLMRLMSGHNSRPASSASTSRRHKSPDPSRKNLNSFTLAGCDRESLMQSLNARLGLSPVQQSEVAKAAASLAVQRKHSTPELPAPGISSAQCSTAVLQQQQPHPQHIINSTPLSAVTSVVTSNTDQKQTPQQPDHQLISHYQQQNQQIYQAVQTLQHQYQKQHQRRSSQPMMGVKLTTARQQQQQQQQHHQDHHQQNSENKALFMASLDAKLQQQQQQGNSSPLSKKRGSLPSEVMRKEAMEMLCNKNASSKEPRTIDTQQQPHNHNHKKQPSKSSSRHSNPSGGVLSGALETFECAIAARVNNWLVGRTSGDLVSCRETLMDQIRKGKELRKVGSSDDRSSPKFA